MSELTRKRARIAELEADNADLKRVARCRVMSCPEQEYTAGVGLCQSCLLLSFAAEERLSHENADLRAQLAALTDESGDGSADCTDACTVHATCREVGQ